MIQTEAKLTGDLDGALEKYADDLKAKVLRAGAGTMAYTMQLQVQLNAARHVVTGNLLSSVYQYYAEDDSTPDKQTYRVGVNRRKAPHWHLLEYGTSKMPKYPIVRPAFDTIQDSIKAGKERMAEELKK